MTGPKISVVMPVMNEERYIRQSIDSILAQTFTDFEFIIIDDGSTDATPDILQNYARRDGRIRIIINEQNIGISRSLNIGLQEATGEYIARMDGDDINTPDRFEKQAALLDQNPDLIIAGAGYQTISADGSPQHVVIEGIERWECEWLSIFRSTILHSIMMYRRSPIIAGKIFYNPAFEYAEDVEFAHRLLRQGAALCLPDVMLSRRFHPVNTTSRNFFRQRDSARRAAVINAKKRFPAIDHAALEELFTYLKPPAEPTSAQCKNAVRTISEIEEFFAREKQLNARQIRKLRNYSARWLAAAAMDRRGGRKIFDMLQLAAAAHHYTPNFAAEAADYLRRRVRVRLGGSKPTSDAALYYAKASA